MKRLMVIVTLLTVNVAMSAEVECMKNGRSWMPSNALAKEIATLLKVKSCRGKKFKEAVTRLGYTTNIPESSKALSVEEVVTKLGTK